MIKSLISGSVKILLRIFVNRISDDDPIKEIAKRQIDTIVEISKIYTDSDPDNSAQMRAVWLRNRKEIILDGISIIILKDDLFIKNPELEQQVDFILETMADSIKEAFELELEK